MNPARGSVRFVLSFFLMVGAAGNDVMQPLHWALFALGLLLAMSAAFSCQRQRQAVQAPRLSRAPRTAYRPGWETP